MAEDCRNYQIRENRVYSFAVVNGNVLRRKCSFQSGLNSVNGKGLNEPQVNTKQSLEGCIKRIQDRGWRLPKLRKMLISVGVGKRDELIFIPFQGQNECSQGTDCPEACQ